MRFSVVENGYDKRQVDACLDELGVRLARLAARAESAAGAAREWNEIREEAAFLSGLLQRLDLGDAAVTRHTQDVVRREAAEILAQARAELDEARAEARQVRERAYAEAVQARREFEAALHARRRRVARADEILCGVTVDGEMAAETVPADTTTAAAGTGVPATRVAAGGLGAADTR
ncbi:ATP synthase F0 subunit B [Micromonospora orduensis]|uniref:ATP synthase F0 subunit B n=1 Tax=Micromonospora orduensis TaxID=1420891 RepID=A0A5C4QZ67_9ACTN|nr:ATP synthase F0 subunit B [Micromonospora orduensis]TNH31277.1 ATP synthase F0 subunit B [Micromonospora orduensis]